MEDNNNLQVTDNDKPVLSTSKWHETNIKIKNAWKELVKELGIRPTITSLAERSGL